MTEEIKEKILDAATTIFAQNGFDGARTRDIAALAKVNISTLHYHFKSKDNIYGSVIKKIHEISSQHMMPTMIEQKKIIDSSKDKKEIIEAIKLMSLTFVEVILNPQNKRYAKIIAFEQIDQSKHFKMIFENVMRRVCEPFTEAVGKIMNKKHDSIEVILLTHSLHSTLTAFQNNKSSLLYLSGWKGYDENNIKHIKKNILRVIDSLLEPYLK
jgi:AcrR family transcriptional regulator